MKKSKVIKRAFFGLLTSINGWVQLISPYQGSWVSSQYLQILAGPTSGSID